MLKGNHMRKEKIGKIIKNIAYSCVSAFVFLGLLFLYDIELFFSSVKNLGFWLYVFGVVVITFIATMTNKNDKTNPNREKVKYDNTVKKNMTIRNTPANIKENKLSGNKKGKETEDIFDFMTQNMKEIKKYYVLSKTMAKGAFTLALIMCILGFAVIILSIAIIFLKNISFLESLTPVIGGTVVEAIAGTAWVVYKKSLEQLNQYYEALHDNEKYLSSVNLVDKLTDDKKDEIYIAIINNQLEKL